MAQLAYEERLASAKAELEEAKRLLQREIADYPHPISGCDAQYVRLISDRTKIINSLNMLGRQPFVATPRILEPTG